MTDEHLYNTITMLRKNQRISHEKAINSIQGSIASATDVMPAPDIEWFKHPMLEIFEMIAISRGIDISE